MNNQVNKPDKQIKTGFKPASPTRRTVRKTLTIDGDLANYIDAKIIEGKNSNLREKDASIN